jgi:hypothetical protein
MGNRYIVSRDNVTATGGNDLLTLISASGRRIRVVEIGVTGQGSSSASQRLIASRSGSGGTTPGGAITPSKFEHSDQPAAAFTTATTWAVQPTPETNGKVIGWNALGGASNWPGPNGGCLEARNGETISLRAPSGPTYQAASLSVVVEED